MPATFSDPHLGHPSGFGVMSGLRRPEESSGLGSVDGSDGRADRLTVTDDCDADHPGVDPRWCRFVEVPEFIALVEVRTQLLDLPGPLGVSGVELPGQPASRYLI